MASYLKRLLAVADDGDEAKADNAITFDEVDIASATADEVKAFMEDDDDNTVLLDARLQESYAGWALEGAADGGHLKKRRPFFCSLD